MGDSYKIAKYLIISSTLVFITALSLSLLLIENKNDEKLFTIILSAPGEVLKVTTTGIIGFISGVMVEKLNRANGQETVLKKKEDEII